MQLPKCYLSFFALLFLPIIVIAQEISAQELLNKAIAYHDPNGNWETFKGNFKVTMSIPNKSSRESDININLPAQFFSVTAVRDSVVTTYTVGKDSCSIFYNEKELTPQAAKEKNMSCENATRYKDYYTYLYGLPMKLKDSGANLHPVVEKKTFKGKSYWVLKVTYDAEVGNDVWYFYFNPKSYAMEVYQFYKTDKKGKEKPNSGEYILLSDETLVNDIKMPKIRAWYYNKDNSYLGTDTLGDN